MARIASVPFGLTRWVAALVVVGMSASSSLLGQTVLQDNANVSLNDGVPYQVREVTIDQKLGDKIPLDLPLRNSEGKLVKTGYFFDGTKPTILTLNYSDCPMLCNVQLNQLTKSLRQLDLEIGTDFNILTVSIDPKESTEKSRDTKDKYVQQLTSGQPNADKGWSFCTADQPIITKLADTVGFRYRYDRGTGEYYHAAMLAFVSPDGVISRYSLTVAFPVNDLRKAIIEAGDGTVGTVIDQAILWCFQFDPDANSYTMVGRKVMYFGGLLFAGGLLATLVPFWIGSRNRTVAVDGSDSAMESSSSKPTQLFQSGSSAP